eukprot:COSAG02_NODE_6377_length_3612_cov_2.589525_3_plen_220_part_00
MYSAAECNETRRSLLQRAEVRIGGESVARRIVPMTNRSLIEQLVFVAQEYKRLPTLGPETSLPDWGGGATHFLECQDSYQHGVAGLQASQVWMLTEAATLLRATGGNGSDGTAETTAAEMESSARTLLRELLPQLSRDPASGGWWHALSPVCADGAHCRAVDDCGCNGTTTPDSVEVRMIHDFLVRRLSLPGCLIPAASTAVLLAQFSECCVCLLLTDD